MKRLKAWEMKPVGWSYGFGQAPRKGFRLGVWGGTLVIKDEFKEWFFRLPFIGIALTITHYAPREVSHQR